MPAAARADGVDCRSLAHAKRSVIGLAHNLAANTGRQRARALPDKMSVRASVRRVTNRKTTPHDAFLSNSHKPRS
jgi:hypothetical protein